MGKVKNGENTKRKRRYKKHIMGKVKNGENTEKKIKYKRHIMGKFLLLKDKKSLIFITHDQGWLQRVKKVCKNFGIFPAKYKNSGNVFFQPENMTRIKKYLTVNLKFFKIYRKSVRDHKILPDLSKIYRKNWLN